MKHAVEQEVGFLLHSRSFTDSRIILELFTRQHGKLKAVHRLPSRKRQATTKPQPFIPLVVHYSGSGELKNLSDLETLSAPILGAGTSLFCGLYLNELLQKLLPIEFEYAGLFAGYQRALLSLSQAVPGEEDIPLREFELQLLAELGYGINFSMDTLGEAIGCNSERFYRFDPADGFTPTALNNDRRALICSGAEIAMLGEGQWQQEETRRIAKRVCRLAVNMVLGGRELKSRELFL